MVEKAWAKIVGSYLHASMMNPAYMMEDLTGAPGSGCKFQNDYLTTFNQQIR